MNIIANDVQKNEIELFYFWILILNGKMWIKYN